MQKFRSHITKTSITFLVCAGLCLYMVQPLNAQQSTRAFSSWLTTVVDHQDSNDLERELEKLSKSGANVYKLMEHASMVMSIDEGQADLPLASSDASTHIYQVLLQQWNYFNTTGKGMANIPPPEIVKSLQSVSLEKTGKVIFAPVPLESFGDSQPNYSGQQPVRAHFNISFEPMVTGIAIGAP